MRDRPRPTDNNMIMLNCFFITKLQLITMTAKQNYISEIRQLRQSHNWDYPTSTTECYVSAKD